MEISSSAFLDRLTRKKTWIAIDPSLSRSLHLVQEVIDSLILVVRNSDTRWSQPWT